MNTHAAIQLTHDSDIHTDPIKALHKATWEDGDYAGFATYMQAGAIEVLEGWNLPPATRLLDVGCGAGQTAIPAAKRGLEVTGLDLADNLIDAARRRAASDGLPVRFDVGDAEALPYADHSYDAVLSMFGAMFAPCPQRVVAEFARVLKPGGRLLMANWTPDSMPAQMFKAVATVCPPAAGSVPPVLWGELGTVTQRLRDEFTDIRLTRRRFPQWHYPFDADELVQLFRTHFGPVKRAFDRCDRAGRAQLHRRLKAIYQANSVVKNGILTITGGDYLDVTATRR